MVWYSICFQVTTFYNSNDKQKDDVSTLRLGEKSAAEISQIFAQSFNVDDWVPKQNPFSDFFQRQRMPKSTVLDRSVGGNDTSSDHETEAFNFSDAMLKYPKSERLQKSINENIHNSTEDSIGMLEAGKLANDYDSSKLNKFQKLQNLSAISKNKNDNTYVGEVDDQIVGESVTYVNKHSINKLDVQVLKAEDSIDRNRSESTQETKVNFGVEIHNVDNDTTWRPLKIDLSGDIAPAHSQLLHENGKMTNISSSDSWIPNSGPITKRRD